MILHISNDFSGSTVYKNLVSQLDNLGLSQIVYNPIRDKNRIGKNAIELNIADSKIIYSNILNKSTDRIFYKKKIKKILRDIESKVDLSRIKLIHAHTWYSDGGVAYLIHKKYNIPFIIAVRSTDIAIHYKYFIQIRRFGKSILNNSNNIILISKFQELFFQQRKSLQKLIIEKYILIPNGIDEFWLNNIYSPSINDSNNFLFIGRFDSNKNVFRLIKALEKCKLIIPNINLNLVGGGGNMHKKVLAEISKKSWIKYHGPIYDKEKLKDIFRLNDFFAMPSIHETFGLVYIEALSQGLPILYTKGQGVDGLFRKVGIATQPKDISSIQKDLIWMIDNKKNLKSNIKVIDFSKFKWESIALKYKFFFSQIKYNTYS